jgi:hypothetical protein
VSWWSRLEALAQPWPPASRPGSAASATHAEHISLP